MPEWNKHAFEIRMRLIIEELHTKGTYDNDRINAKVREILENEVKNSHEGIALDKQDKF